MILIETRRLLLRNVRPGDVRTIYDYRNDEKCARYQRSQVRDYEGIADMVEQCKQADISVDHAFMMAVALKPTDEMVGEIVVMPNDGTISLGCTFSHGHHGKGYAFESLHTLMDVLHGRYPQWDFVVFIHPENKPSLGLVRKLGFEEMGYLPAMESQVFGKWLTQRTREEFETAMGASG